MSDIATQNNLHLLLKIINLIPSFLQNPPRTLWYNYLIKGTVIGINAIYIDVLFFVNLVINICLIACCGTVLKLTVKPWRLMASASVGALYSCFTFVGDFGALSSVAMRISFALLITLTAFGSCPIRQLIKRCALFFLFTVTFGLITLGVLYFSDIGLKLGGVIKNGVFYFNIPMWYMICCCTLAYIAISIGEKLLKKHTCRSYAKVKLEHLGKSVELKALIDTGNMLKDPFTGKKVLIAEADVVSPLFDFDAKSISDWENLPEGFRLIPFSSLGTSNGLLAAFVPDVVSVESVPKNDIITAVFSGTLSQSGDYNALIGPE